MKLADEILKRGLIEAGGPGSGPQGGRHAIVKSTTFGTSVSDRDLDPGKAKELLKSYRDQNKRTTDSQKNTVGGNVSWRNKANYAIVQHEPEHTNTDIVESYKKDQQAKKDAKIQKVWDKIEQKRNSTT